MILEETFFLDLSCRLRDEDEASSSHWNYYHKFLKINDDNSIQNTMGFGDGKKTIRFLQSHSIGYYNIIITEQPSNAFF